MGFGSQSGILAVRSQPTADTFAADFDAAHVAMKLRSGSLAPSRDLLITDPEIGGGRDTVDAYLGAVAFAGDLEFYARLESLTSLFKAGLGTAATSTTTGVSTHTITPTDSATLPFLSIYERIGSGLEAYKYTDAVVNTLHLEAEANGYLMGTAGLIARKQVAAAVAPGSVLYDESFLTVGTNITITYNAVTLAAKSFALDINNNVEDDDFRLGSFYLGELTAKSREVNGSFTIRPSDSALWRQAVYGTSAATAPGGISTKQQLVITCTTFEDIVGGTPATKSSIVITIPKVILEPYAFEPSGDDVIENDISWRAVRPAAATPIVTTVIKTAKAAIA